MGKHRSGFSKNFSKKEFLSTVLLGKDVYQSKHWQMLTKQVFLQDSPIFCIIIFFRWCIFSVNRNLGYPFNKQNIHYLNNIVTIFIQHCHLKLAAYDPQIAKSVIQKPKCIIYKMYKNYGIFAIILPNLSHI